MNDMVITFTRQLYALIKAGVPLLKALQIIDVQLPAGKFKQKVDSIIQQIQEGKTLSEALTATGEFSIFYLDMIKAAEISGNLTIVLKELNAHYIQARRVNQQIRAALMYPIFVLATAVIILAVLMLFVLPVFFKIFEDLGVGLPPITLFLIGTSKFMVRWSWVAVVLGIIAAFVVYFMSKSPAGSRIINRFKWSFPVFGEVIRTTEIGRFCRTLGTLLGSGVALMKALEALIDTTQTILLKEAVEKIKTKVEGGENLSMAMEQTGVFPITLVRMIQVGEESGKFADILVDVAQDMEEEAYFRIAGLLSLLEPALIVIMGGIVGFIVISLFLPIFTMGGLIK